MVVEKEGGGGVGVEKEGGELTGIQLATLVKDLIERKDEDIMNMHQLITQMVRRGDTTNLKMRKVPVPSCPVAPYPGTHTCPVLSHTCPVLSCACPVLSPCPVLSCLSCTVPSHCSPVLSCAKKGMQGVGAAHGN